MNPEEREEKKCFGNVRNGVRTEPGARGREKRGKTFLSSFYLSWLG